MSQNNKFMEREKREREEKEKEKEKRKERKKREKEGGKHTRINSTRRITEVFA